MLKEKITFFAICCLVLSIQGENIDFFLPEMLTIKDNYLQQKNELKNARKTELTQLIDSCMAQTEKQEKEQKTRGNISTMAAAQRMSRTLSQYKNELDEKNDFKLSAQNRRETQEISDRIAKEKNMIDLKYKELQLEALTKAQNTFKKAAILQQNLADISEDRIKEEFEKLTKTGKPLEESPTQTMSANGETKRTEDSLFADYLAAKQKEDVVTSGEAEHWQSFASIKGAVNAIVIFDIPMAGIAETKTFEGMREGNAYKLEYTPVDKLNTNKKIFFMIQNLNLDEKFDVINWPSERNGWTLSIRLRPNKTYPSNHRMELKIGGEVLTTEEEQSKAKSAQPINVKIQISSIPDNAYVYIDDKPVRLAGGFAVTPCIITIPAGKYNLAIKKIGFQSKVIEDFVPEHKQSYSHILLRSKNVNESTTKVESKNSWTSSNLLVNKGDTVVCQTKGEWSIGKDNERTDYKGYPNNSSYFKYYIEEKYHPSIMKDVNYGALIAKIGNNGKLFAVSSKPMIATETGIIYYTANELESSKSDNVGYIYVKTQINPEE